MSLVGTVRPHNEDACRAEEELGLFVVADGLGGHRAGEHASNMAVEVLEHTLQEARDNGDLPDLDLVLDAFDRANHGILTEARNSPERQGMGTTLTAIVVVGDHLLLGHVGDSRAWRIRDEVIEQITQDHTVVGQQVRDGVLSEADAETHPMRHVLSRCLGVHEEIEVDLAEGEITPGDIYVLASDGLVPSTPAADLARIVKENSDAKVAAEVLANRACERDGRDNITVVVVVCAED